MDVICSKEAFLSATSGAAADVCQVLLLYPMETMKVKLQADSSLKLSTLLHTILASKNLSALYTGVESKLLQSPQGKFQYFYTNIVLTTFYKKTLTSGRKLTTLEALMIGYLSGKHKRRKCCSDPALSFPKSVHVDTLICCEYQDDCTCRREGNPS